MASVMVASFKKIVHMSRIELGDVPKGVQNDAQRFFNLVLQAAGDNLPDNPPASVNAYVIAADAVKESSHSVLKTRQEFQHYLQRLSDFVGNLQLPRDLTEEELETAQDLRKFFLQLHRRGEAEAYGHSVHLEVPLSLKLF
jgi:hypothetical protein